MPIVSIETRRGLAPETKRGLLEATHAALQAAFKIPGHDRTQRIVEHAPEDFEIPAGKGERFTLVTITCFAGRSHEAKRRLYRELVDRLEPLGIPRNDVFIVLNEQPPENWGLRDGQSAADVDLGFEIKV